MPKIKSPVGAIVKYCQIPIFAIFAILGITHLPDFNSAHATACPDVKVIFARGSGGERYATDSYLTFKEAMEAKLNTSNLTYEIDDLDYPAISIGINDGHFTTLVNAFIGGGESYDFGDSVHAGAKNLAQEINRGCPSTKYVIAGYSQGAIVVMDALSKINPDKIIYAATFGDPKIYLPEGAGAVPIACRGEGLSSYRIYVPDCKAYKGLLGARTPYITSAYDGKVGTWCNRYDILCSSHYSIKSHTAYVKDGLFEDASRFIFSKIAATFNFKNEYTSPHDTAILIDSTGSMSGLISQYKAEAYRLAEKTLAAGGRVALYDYRDVQEGYTPVEHCNFETCDLNTFQSGLDAIAVDGGGDTPESLLSASLHVMQKLKWKFGSTKSLVILTDAGYHSPDYDGTTFYDVVKLSKQIDPVNFYIITPSDYLSEYQELATATGGAVASSTDDLSILTDTILEHYESLPRVEENETDDDPAPTLTITNTETLPNSNVQIDFETDGAKTMVIINDAIMGVTTEHSLTITDLNRDVLNTITLVPLSDTRRGEAVTVEFEAVSGYGSTIGYSDTPAPNTTTLKAPNTGRL